MPSPLGFEIRSAVPADAAEWVRMREALWPEYEPVWHAAEVEKYFAGQLTMPLEVLVAADEQGRHVGFAELSIRPYAEGCLTDRVAFLEGWYVEPGARGRGIGRALVAAAERWAERQGCTEFGSDAVLDNTDSAKAHAAVGFEETGQIRCFKKAVSRSTRIAPTLDGVSIEEASPHQIAGLQDAIKRGLMAFNVEYVGPPGHQELALAARDAQGHLVGGLYGSTAWRWLFVDLLWVDTPFRRQGLGRRLLRAAEAAARARGCTHAYLDTFDFQARPFYEREGYTLFGTQEGYPPGHRKFYLCKSLGADA
jgi:aminoglycoside 6'-N-acetyltransferase I